MHVSNVLEFMLHGVVLRMMNSRLDNMMKQKIEAKSEASRDAPLSVEKDNATPLDVSGKDSLHGFTHNPALTLRLDQIDVEAQVRHTFEEVALRAASIKEDGQLQPIVVEPLENGRYRLLAGECRYRAFRLLEKEDAKQYGAIDVTVKARIDDPIERTILQVVENIQREDLKDFELAEAAKNIMAARDWNQSQLVSRLNVSKSKLTKALMLLEMDEALQASVRDGTLSAHAARVSHKQSLTEKRKSSSSPSSTSSMKTESAAKVARIAVSLSQIESTCFIFQKLAEQLGLPAIKLSKKPNRRELIQTIEQRTQDIHKAYL